MSYLERYLASEHEQVWAELVALGEAVRDEPVYSDALAVARETMRRVRWNIETLIPCLIAIGYQFGYGWVQPFVRERLLKPYSINFDPDTGRYIPGGVLRDPPERHTYGFRMAYRDYLELAESMPSLFSPANDREERLEQLEHTSTKTAPSQHVMREQLRAMQADLRAKPSAHDLLAQLESSLGILPLSVKAWYEEVGGVNFVGDHPGWRSRLPELSLDRPDSAYEYLNPLYALDPLFIYPLDEDRVTRLNPGTKEDKDGADYDHQRHPLLLAPGERMKYLDNSGTGGAHIMTILLPAAVLDTRCVIGSDQTFVTYLRECFRWGGFPGWERIETRPDEDLAYLTEGLQPI
jgi:hypothetical protein